MLFSATEKNKLFKESAIFYLLLITSPLTFNSCIASTLVSFPVTNFVIFQIVLILLLDFNNLSTNQHRANTRTKGLHHIALDSYYIFTFLLQQYSILSILTYFIIIAYVNESNIDSNT
jgi:hypothetical protein